MRWEPSPDCFRGKPTYRGLDKQLQSRHRHPDSYPAGMRMVMLATALLMSSSARADLTKARCNQLAEILTDLSDATRENEDAQAKADTSSAIMDTSGSLKESASRLKSAEYNFLVAIRDYRHALDDSIYQLRACAK